MILYKAWGSIRKPAAEGKLQHGTDLSELTQVLDLLPTLIDLRGLRAEAAKFSVPLKAGQHQLTANFLDQKGAVLCGAFYVKPTLTR